MSVNDEVKTGYLKGHLSKEFQIKDLHLPDAFLVMKLLDQFVISQWKYTFD